MSPKKTSLYPVHEKLGASFTDFGGWDMPLKYSNDVAEHEAVRTARVSSTSLTWVSSV